MVMLILLKKRLYTGPSALGDQFVFDRIFASQNIFRTKLRGLFQIQLLATTIAFSTLKPTVASRISLSSRQQASLAELIHFTMDAGTDLSKKPTYRESTDNPPISWTDEVERGCIESIVRHVDAHFTSLAPKSALDSLWSTDYGVSDDIFSQITNSLRNKLTSMHSLFECEPIISEDLMNQEEAEVLWSGWPLSKQHRVARQAANALLKACRHGKSANFKVTESQADQLLRLLTPLVLEAHSYIILVSFVLLATAGALVCVDTLAHKLMGCKRKEKFLQQAYNDCACFLCSGKLERGNSIGEGGFGQVYLCTDQSSREETPKVVKMIGADFEKDVTVLQDALDEAKHLLSLKHRNIVRYYDVFVHRDVEGIKCRDEKRLTKSKANKPDHSSSSGYWGWGERVFNSKKDKSPRKDSPQYDYVCIVMEYCAGGTLLEYVASGVLLPLDVVVNTFLQVISALNHIHNKNIVHFDVKLENIFIARDVASHTKRRRRKRGPISPPESPHGFTIKVGDFGLAMRHCRPTHASKNLLNNSLFASPSSILTSSPPNKECSNASLEVFPILRQAHHLSPNHTGFVGPVSLSRLELKRRTTTKAKPEVVMVDELFRDDEDDSQASNSSSISGDEITFTDEDDSVAEYPSGQGCVAGTAPYQPPEVFRGHTEASQLGPEVDVWALGCALYEAVTCQSLPLEAPYIGQLAMRPETWAITWEKLFKVFSENVDIMVACALGESHCSARKGRPRVKKSFSSPVERLKSSKKEMKEISQKKNKAKNENKQNHNDISDKQKQHFEQNEVIAAGVGLCSLLEQCLNPDATERPQLSLLLSYQAIWLKSFQSQPLRFGNAFGKPNTVKNRHKKPSLDDGAARAKSAMFV